MTLFHRTDDKDDEDCEMLCAVSQALCANAPPRHMCIEWLTGIVVGPGREQRGESNIGPASIGHLSLDLLA